MNKKYCLLLLIILFVLNLQGQSILFITDTIDTYQSLPITYLIKGLHFRKYSVAVYCTKGLSLKMGRTDVLNELVLLEFPVNLDEYSTIICSNVRIAKEYIYLKELDRSKKFITIVNGDDFTVQEYYTNDILKNLFLMGDLFLVTSQYARYLLDLCNLSDEKALYFPLPVDCLKSQFQINLFDPKKEIKFILVDEFSTDSGIEVACRALCMLEKVKFTCTVVCNDKKAKRLKELYPLIKFNFIKVESIKQFIQLFEQHHVLIMTPMTSIRGVKKGIPVSILEAMAHGVLVIASRHGGICDVIRNNENGYLVPEQDHETLLHTIRLALFEKKTWPSKVLLSREIILARHERVDVMRKLHALLSRNL